ncbi:AAA domain-containing protein [Phycicoccus sp.]|uniref:AAA domain-containing protein n=1 Tax=Phycicoccus sp. TaxID=1902410 RepID=UPI002BDFB23C|nr:AAA domain-containing protein [Phycicoccus sp.]HMM95002.1 AAA domain-containing protein [Phycicoccus sp.]
MTASGPARDARPRGRAGVADAVPEDRHRGGHLSIAPDAATVRAERVAEARARWTRHLVELGGPNTLLWYRDLPVGTLDLSTAHLGSRSTLLAGGSTLLSELVREPHALDEARTRLGRIHDTATEIEREHAVRTCFLGIGMASWTIVLEDGRVVPRQPGAPVFLRALRTRPTDARRRDWVLEPGDELEVNPALVHYLESEHGISLDTDRLEHLATAAGAVDPYPAYAALADACRAVRDLSVDPRVVVSTFPYHKAPLVADLAAQADTLARHDVVAALAGFADALPAVAVGAERGRGPAEDFLVLDADAAQREAVEAVRAGSHLLLHAPPSTGASQTVANLAAALAADGRRVLVVSPKRTALDAVRSRLDEVGLGDLVLDLADGGHARRSVVRELVEGLDRVLERGARPGSRRQREREAAEDAEARRSRAAAAALLDEHLRALHGRRDPWAVTLHEVQEEVCRHAALPQAPRSRVRLEGAVLLRLDRASLDEAGDLLTRLAALAAWDGDGADDPWFGAALHSPEEAAEARERVERLATGLVGETRRILGDVFRGVHLPAAPTVLDWDRVLATVGQVRDTLEVFRPEVFDIPLDDLVAATATGAERRAADSDLGVVERWRVRRQARALLRPGRPPADLHAALVEAQMQRHAWRELAGSGGRPEIPVELDRARAAHDALVDDLSWVDDRLPHDEEDLDLVELDLGELADRMGTLHAAARRLDAAPDIRLALDLLDRLGLTPLVEDLRARGVPAERVRTELDWVWWCSIADEVGAHDGYVTHFDPHALTAAVATLVASDREALEGQVGRVHAAVAERVAEVRRARPDEETRLRAEAARARRPSALPELFASVGTLATAVRPIWLASPLTVPSVLPPGECVDVVVVDEASLVAPAEAVAAVSRGRRVVVVGDPAQLPPVPFVVSAGVDAPEEADSESVVDALDGVLPTRRLTWQYGALDERLVAFADAQLYDGTLVTFPGTGTAPVVRHELVDGHGVVAEGEAAVESTPAEVDRVVELVLEHARRRPERSLAVIALGPGHRRLVEDAVRHAVEGLGDEVAAFFAEDRPEAFSVRDADHVQGETWDDVVLTVGFGKTPHGRVLHRFGPIATDTGHRRLGVALTRARRALTVVSSIGAEALDPDRLRTSGARMLRDLLEHVEAVTGDDVAPTAGRDGSSLVLADLARRLREHGLVVHESVGTSALPVELGIEDPTAPGRLLLAVEGDGPAYAAVLSGRDRDLVRVAELERRGWRHLRVWTTEVFRDPARVVSRVLDAVGVRQAPGG